MGLTTERADSPPPRDTAEERRGPALEDREQAEGWLDTELDNFLAAAHAAANHVRPDHTGHQSTIRHSHFRTAAAIPRRKLYTATQYASPAPLATAPATRTH